MNAPAAAVCLLLVAALQDTKVTATPFRISESRSRDIRQVGKKVQRMGPSLKIHLLLEGKPLESASHWGFLKITEAKDDRGTDLTGYRGYSGLGNSFDKINREHMWFFEKPAPTDKLKLEISVKAPPRGATKLASLKGSIKVAVLTTRDVHVGSLAAQAGKSVRDAALKEAGVNVEITKVTPKDANNLVALKIADPGKKMVEVSLVDQNGKKVSTGQSYFGFGNVKQYQISGHAPLAAGTRLRISIRSGQKETVVPFAIKDMQLP